MLITIEIPENVKLLVKENQSVDFSTPLWEETSEETIEINVAKKLGIKPDKIFDYLKKFINEKVKKDEIIAEKKGLLINKKIISPKDGEIKEINHELGIIIIGSLTQKKIVNSFFKAEIVNIEKSSLKIKINSGHSYLIKKVDIDFGGKVYYYKNQDLITSDQIEKKIIVFDNIDSLTQIKMEALGSIGFVGTRPLPEKTQLPFFQLKNQKDIEKIYELKKSSCIITKIESKIIFYE